MKSPASGATLSLVPLWLLALVLAVAPARAAALPLEDLDRALLLQARYQVAGDDVRTPAPESKELADAELAAVLEKLRAAQRQAALTELERAQDKFLQDGKLDPETLEKARLTLAQNWDLLPKEARGGFNAVLSEAGGSSVRGPDLSRLKASLQGWDKSEEALPAYRRDPYARRGFYDGPDLAPPGFGVNGAPAYGKELKKRLERVDAATYQDGPGSEAKPYSEDVRRALREVMRYASEEDSAAVLRVLEKTRPVITWDNAALFANAFGVAHAPGSQSKGEDAAYRLAVCDSVVYVKKAGTADDYDRLPFVEGKFYKELGLPLPALQAFDPAAKPTKVDKLRDGTVVQYFADGSVRDRQAPENNAPLLLHEILHLDTAAEGAGSNSFSNEMRSFYAMNRLRYNRDEARGDTRRPDYGKDNVWLNDPRKFRADILAAYTSPAVGEVQKDSVLVADELARNARMLEARGEDFERLKKEYVERRLKSAADADLTMLDELRAKGYLTDEQRDAGRQAVDRKIAKYRAQMEALDFRKDLEEERARLLKDQALTLRIVGQDIDYHRARGVPYVKAEAAK